VDGDRFVLIAVNKEERPLRVRTHDVDRADHSGVNAEHDQLHEEDARYERGRHPGLGRKVLGQDDGHIREGRVDDDRADLGIDGEHTERRSGAHRDADQGNALFGEPASTQERDRRRDIPALVVAERESVPIALAMTAKVEEHDRVPVREQEVRDALGAPVPLGAIRAASMDDNDGPIAVAGKEPAAQAQAVARELERQALGQFLDELDRTLGPVSETALRRARRAWPKR